jgi:bifunctional DNase/RNase
MTTTGRRRSFLVVAAAALLFGCSRGKFSPSRGDPPPRGSSGPSAPRDRHETDAPLSDPSKKPPAGYKRMAVGGIAPTEHGSAVVLADDSAKTGLLIFVGGSEALSIALRLEHKKYERPLTHDLLDNVLKKLGGDVVSVRVDRLEDDVFYGSVLIHRDGRLFEVDARPSDALALAIGNSAPVYVSENVIKQAGIDIEKFDMKRLSDDDEAVPASRAGEVEL